MIQAKVRRNPKESKKIFKGLRIGNDGVLIYPNVNGVPFERITRPRANAGPIFPMIMREVERTAGVKMDFWGFVIRDSQLQFESKYHPACFWHIQQIHQNIDSH